MRLKDEDLKEIAKLIDEGWSCYQLANKYNYPNGAMYKQLGFKTLEKPDFRINPKNKVLQINQMRH